MNIMFSNVDRVLTLIGLAIAFPGVLLLFSDHVAVGILESTLVLLIITIWYYSNKQLITILEVEKTTVIKDDQGINSSFTGRQKTKTNHKGLTELWFRNISADGVVENILIDNKPPSSMKKEAGDICVCIRFNRAKPVHEQFEATLTFDAKNSFLEKTEFVTHSVEAETKLLKIIVELPSSRKATAARLFLQYGGNPHKELKKPLMSSAGQRLEAEIKRPLLGAEYCLEWDW